VSDIFESVVFRGAGSDMQRLLDEAGQSVPVILERVGDGLNAISRTDARATGPVSEAMEHVASAVSQQAGSALLFRYDGRIGYRESKLYESGQLVREFGPSDERWVRLDEHGDTVPNATTYSADQLDSDPNAEYETVRDAIELGLDAFGAGDRDEIFDAMS
jgi:hypothetical protein